MEFSRGATIPFRTTANRSTSVARARLVDGARPIRSNGPRRHLRRASGHRCKHFLRQGAILFRVRTSHCSNTAAITGSRGAEASSPTQRRSVRDDCSHCGRRMAGAGEEVPRQRREVPPGGARRPSSRPNARPSDASERPGSHRAADSAGSAEVETVPLPDCVGQVGHRCVGSARTGSRARGPRPRPRQAGFRSRTARVRAAIVNSSIRPGVHVLQDRCAAARDEDVPVAGGLAACLERGLMRS